MEKVRYFMILLEVVVIIEALPYPERQIKDPYRWLENPNSEETKAFVDAQNQLTNLFLSNGSLRKDINNTLTRLSDFPVYSCPQRHGNKYYFNKKTGLKTQSVLYVQDTLNSEPKVFLDLNDFSEDALKAISYKKFSDDGKIMAFSLSNNGSDWRTIWFINTETGTLYPEALGSTKYSTITWTGDSKAVFYSSYTTVPKEHINGKGTQGLEHQKLFYHIVGTPQSEDVLVVDFPEEPLWLIEAHMTNYEKRLIISVTKNSWSNLIFVTKPSTDGTVKEKFDLMEVVGVFDAFYDYVTNDGPNAIFLTDYNAPNKRLVRINLKDPAKEKWTVLLSEHPENVLESVEVVAGDKFVARYTQNIKSILQLHSLKTGELLKTLFLDVGTIDEISCSEKNSEIFFKFTSFLTPGRIYTMDLAKDDAPKILRESEIHNFDLRAFKSAQVFYTSKDGTRIPMSILMKTDAVLNRSMPALLTGYGGFGVSVQPEFSPATLVFIKHFNGVFAVANIRGGGEYGKRCHDAARLFNKQNVFDDFQRAAEYLIDNKYTTPSKLILQADSNGGLLVAASISQRPDLFGGAIAEMGVMDMLRYDKFTIGYAWVSEYDSPDDPRQFENLLKYSPLHNVKAPSKGVQFPATLLLTVDHDDRDVPLHSFKLAATLQHDIGRLPDQSNPIMIKIEIDAGHGGEQPAIQLIEENTDIVTFIAKTLNLTFWK